MERSSLEELRCFRTKLAQQFASPVYGKNPSASKKKWIRKSNGKLGSICKWQNGLLIMKQQLTQILRSTDWCIEGSWWWGNLNPLRGKTQGKMVKRGAFSEWISYSLRRNHLRWSINDFAFGYLHLPFHVRFIEQPKLFLVWTPRPYDSYSPRCCEIFGPDLGSSTSRYFGKTTK